MNATRNASRLTIALALGFAAAAGAPAAAYAVTTDTSCRVTTYYAEAGLKTKVGSLSTCPASHSHTGRTTKFAYTEVVEPEQPVDPFVHPGSLPCEWPLECANESSIPAGRLPVAQKKQR